MSFGDEMKFDDEIVVLEAMKMNDPICGPANGRIKEIRVKKNTR
jgi:biotin carboxyl carrier protein